MQGLPCIYLVYADALVSIGVHMRCNAGGFEDWVVSCRCGTRIDDGERMVACDVCGVWMHTRCHGMPDSEPIPEEFVCTKCAMY